MFQLRRRAEHPSGSLRKSGSVDDVKMPRMLPTVAQNPGKLTLATCFTAHSTFSLLSCMYTTCHKLLTITRILAECTTYS